MTSLPWILLTLNSSLNLRIGGHRRRDSVFCKKEKFELLHEVWLIYTYRAGDGEGERALKRIVQFVTVAGRECCCRCLRPGTPQDSGDRDAPEFSLLSCLWCVSLGLAIAAAGNTCIDSRTRSTGLDYPRRAPGGQTRLFSRSVWSI